VVGGWVVPLMAGGWLVAGGLLVAGYYLAAHDWHYLLRQRSRVCLTIEIQVLSAGSTPLGCWALRT
jgi:hypothetical protein